MKGLVSEYRLQLNNGDFVFIVANGFSWKNGRLLFHDGYKENDTVINIVGLFDVENIDEFIKL